jgi:Dolichyl-phosphate-mannose-protein mannosyltransferase
MKRLLYISLFIFFTNALIFIIKFAEIPIFDDFEHLLDVHIYYEKGINIGSVMLHGNESGVFADWIWAIAGRIFGDSLVIYRLVDWLCLLVFFLILIKIALKNTHYQCSIFISIIFLMSSVYANLTVATVLTEAPSLLLYLCTCLGLIIYRHSQNQFRWFYLLASCICMGLCIITRFYQMALLGTVGIFLLAEHYPKINFNKAFLQLLIVLVGMIPFLWIVFLWKGIVPPGFKTRYPEFVSDIGINVIRPFTVFLHIGIWGSPLILLSWKWTRQAFNSLLTKNLKILLIISFVSALMLKLQGVYFWNFSINNPVSSGMIDLIVKKLNSINYWAGFGADVFLIGYGLFFSGVIFHLVFQEIKTKIIINKHIQNQDVSIAIILYSYLIFYILQQFFVTGNVQFFERYMLLIYPAMSFLIYQFIVLKIKSSDNHLDWKVATYLVISIAFSCFNIWRYPSYGQSKKVSCQKVETVKCFAQNSPNEIINH